MRVVRITLVAAGLVLGVVAYRIQMDNLEPDDVCAPRRSWPLPGPSLSPASSPGSAARRTGSDRCWRRASRSSSASSYSNDPLVFTVFALGEASYAMVAHSVLAYPSGRVIGRPERALMKVGYASMLFPLAILLVYDGKEPLRFMNPAPRESLLLVWPNGELAVQPQKAFVVFVWGSWPRSSSGSTRAGWRGRRRGRAASSRRFSSHPSCSPSGPSSRASSRSPNGPPKISTSIFCGRSWASWLSRSLCLRACRARLARAGAAELVLELERAPPHDLGRAPRPHPRRPDARACPLAARAQGVRGRPGPASDTSGGWRRPHGDDPRARA